MLFEIEEERVNPFSNIHNAIGYILALDRNRKIYLPVLPSQNCLITGITGSGKTTITKELVRKNIEADSDLNIVFLQIKPGDFSGNFMRSQDKMICYAKPPEISDEQLFRWSLISEIRASREPNAEIRRFAEGLFLPLSKDERNAAWIESAKQLMIAFLSLNVFHAEGTPTNAFLKKSFSEKSAEELFSFLSMDKANRAFLRRTFGYVPSAAPDNFNNTHVEDVMFLCQAVLHNWDANFCLHGKCEDTIDNFLKGKGNRLFIQHDLAHEDASRVFESFILKKIISDKMSASSSYKNKILLVLDEADKVGFDFGINKCACLGRGFGLNLILSTQSIEHLFAVADQNNRDHDGMALLAGFQNHIVFHAGDPTTVNTYQKLFGNRYVDVYTLSHNRESPLSVQKECRPIVTDEEFSSLGCGYAFVKFGSNDPVKLHFIEKGDG